MKNKFKNTKIVLLILVITFITAQTATAQQERPPQRPQEPPLIPDKEQIQQLMKDLDSTLSLNDEQMKKISDLFISHFKAVENILNQEREAMEKTRIEMDKSRTSFEMKVKSLLSDEQQKKFDAFQKDHGPEKGKGKKPVR